jgi:(1->4)-alpha-D-glucan 1-alpha-D-glucosylmutase
LKFTSPGIPDVYQGCELHDLSLVDPDNRRPVDYTKRERMLSDLEVTERTQPTALWQNRFSGQAKLWLTHRLLANRRTQGDFWSTAEYVPLPVEGRYRDHILAFARQKDNTTYVTIVPLHLARLCRETGISDPLAIDWQDTQVGLPAGANWHDCLADRTGNTSMVSDLFANTLPLGFIKFNQ